MSENESKVRSVGSSSDMGCTIWLIGWLFVGGYVGYEVVGWVWGFLVWPFVLGAALR